MGTHCPGRNHRHLWNKLGTLLEDITQTVVVRPQPLEIGSVLREYTMQTKSRFGVACNDTTHLTKLIVQT